MMARTGLAALVAMTSLFFVMASASAIVPTQMHYQGLLLDSAGAPLTSAVDLDFELFDAITAGTSLWTESHSAVSVVDGVYSVALGSIVALDSSILAPTNAFLEVTVDGETLTPRQQLLAVPYALVAENVGTISSGFVEQLLLNGTFDGGLPDNFDPREGLADVDGDGIANFVDSDNDNDGLSDVVEVGLGSDINLVTPTVSSYSPATADGFLNNTITIFGTNLDTVVSVQIGAASPVPTSVTATSLDVLVPGPQPSGTAVVTVSLANGETVNSAYGFFLISPTISSFSPSTADGFLDNVITVFGTDLDTVTSVQFGTATPIPTAVTATSFDVLVTGTQPSGSAIVTVTLTNGESVDSTYDFFFVPPTITSIAPNPILVSVATTVTVTGTNFIAGLVVEFDGAPIVPTSMTPTSLTLDLDPLLVGDYVVTVTHPNGEAASDTLLVRPNAPKTVFVTSSVFPGNFGGIAAADASCQSLASGAGLTGIYKAWLSDSSSSPASTFTLDVGPYLLPNGTTVVADSFVDLVDGNLDSAINRTETGALVFSGLAWTATGTDGLHHPVTGDCSDWTSLSPGFVARGLVTSPSSNWTVFSLVDCSLSGDHPLYCFEQ